MIFMGGSEVRIRARGLNVAMSIAGGGCILVYTFVGWLLVGVTRYVGRYGGSGTSRVTLMEQIVLVQQILQRHSV